MAEHINPPIPAGFTEVSRERFFVLLTQHGEAVDPMPKSEPTETIWEAQRGTRFMWGWSVPGWRNAGAPRQYAVRSDFAQKGKP